MLQERERATSRKIFLLSLKIQRFSDNKKQGYFFVHYNLLKTSGAINERSNPEGFALVSSGRPLTASKYKRLNSKFPNKTAPVLQESQEFDV
jgi:hypothetical protein